LSKFEPYFGKFVASRSFFIGDTCVIAEFEKPQFSLLFVILFQFVPNFFKLEQFHPYPFTYQI